MSYRFEVKLNKSEDPKRQSNPYVNIYVKTYSQDSENRILITSDCYTKQEIDHEVDNLIKDLEAIRNKAKKKI